MAQASDAVVILGKAANHLIHGLPVALKTSGAWLAVFVLASLPLAYWLWANVDNVNAEAPTWFWLLSFCLVVFSVAPFSSVAVNWHRFVIQGQKPSGTSLLRLDGKVVRYFGNWILVGLITGLLTLIPYVLLMLPLLMAGVPVAFFSTEADTQVASPLTAFGVDWLRLAWDFIIYAIGSFFFFRSGLKLPAVAIGRRDFGIGASWGMTSEHASLLIWVAVGLAGIVTFAPVLLAFPAMFISDTSTVGAIVWVLLFVVFLILLGVYCVGVLSELYLRLVVAPGLQMQQARVMLPAGVAQQSGDSVS